MGSCREVLTLQLGTTANFVGSQWWSMQEMGFSYDPNQKSEICHDILFREGLTIRGEVTFTPRVLCVERTSKLPPISTLQDPPSQAPILYENFEKIEIPSDPFHPFIEDLNNGVDTSGKEYDFENSVRGWGDILRTRLHPRSLFAGYTPDDDEEIQDRIRQFVEECDNIQGFNIMVDGTESFPDVMAFLDDEFSSKPRLTFPIVRNVGGEIPWKEAGDRLLRIFSAYHTGATLSSLTIPISCVKEFSMKQEESQLFPNLVYQPTLYHTSSILASFLDCFSLTYRTQDNPADLSDVISGITSRGWKFGNASLSLPFPITPNSTLEKFLENRDDSVPIFTSLTPGSNTDNSFYQTLGFRGLSDNGVLLRYLQFLSSTISSVKSITTPMPILSPFPKIFSPHVSTKGSVDATASRMPGFEVNSVSVLAGLHACHNLGNMLTNLINLVSNPRLKSIAIEETDMFAEKLENMKVLAENHSLITELF